LSPLFNSGKIITSNGGFDYFGNMVPNFQNPDIGFYEYSNSLTNYLLEIGSKKNLIFPNPVDQFLLINKRIYGEDFKLVNSSGKVVLKGKLKSILNTSSFKEGIYFLHILNSKKINKIIINHIK
jgi:hypothetical protein